ncbi:MAG: DUF1294 domain-containing protein [Ruminococcaceae bacterium]|nr:DUF1294 domain-containing protein [Oscillospiraceae bacterium]
MPQTVKIQLAYFLAVSVIGLILTVYDKIAAKIAKRHRVPEKILMTFGILGGALVMYIIMQLIRHKTRKRKFAVGFPVIIVLETTAVIAFNFLLT